MLPWDVWGAMTRNDAELDLRLHRSPGRALARARRAISTSCAPPTRTSASPCPARCSTPCSTVPIPFTEGGDHASAQDRLPRRMAKSPPRAARQGKGASSGARRSSPASAARCPGSRSTRTTCSTGRTASETLADLFAGRSQLIVKHFMLGPDWQEGCVGCSFGADQMEGSLVHLVNHDVMLVAVSRAPYPEDRRLPQAHGLALQVGVVRRLRLQLRLQRLVHRGADQAKGKVFYNFEERGLVSDELPGFSVFTRDEPGQIFHTYSVFARGTERSSARSTASSTSRPRAATSRPAATCPTGSATTTNMRKRPIIPAATG